MREPSMKCFIQPRRDNGEDDQPDGDAAAGLAALPESLLLRHGALALNPATAVSVPGWAAPRSTVYRARTLLVPGEALGGAQHDGINTVLARAGMRLVAPFPSVEANPRPQLSRPALLIPQARTNGATASSAVIDAWVALQTLRAAADAREQDLDRQTVGQISLEHLLIGAAITGSPITEGGGLSGGNPGGVTGPTCTDSYLYNGGDGRAPVDVCMEAPDWSTTERCAEQYGRRAVVAVLDTGVRAHSWLDVHAKPTAPGGYVADGFVEVSQEMQDLISAQAATLGAGSFDLPRQVIKLPWDQPVTEEPLVGELDTHTGHGTFIAGIVRQVAPRAKVLSLRIMHSDGIVYEGDLICALGLLAERVAAAQGGDMSGMVDVVCLSLGYYSESAADVVYSSGLRAVIDELLGLGVAVIAAAGNYASSRRFYPAAFASQPPSPESIPLISVGALNPNGSKALFSDGGSWVTAWAPGAAMISTFPQDINGSRAPEIRMRAHPANEPPAAHALLPATREALDPDDYSGGFAAWSGTSFAAPLLAAQVARSLMTSAAEPGSGLRLDVAGTQAATQRMVAAFEDLGW